jgi:exodeoxyribonuclease VII large subunit
MSTSHLSVLPGTALSILSLTQYIQVLLEQDPHLAQIWVVGEVTSVSDRGGHVFLTLQDAEDAATIQAAVWKNVRSRLAVQPAVGEQFFVLGQVWVYAQRGYYQLIVLQLLPAGAGLQALRRQQLYPRLAAEGLFDPTEKLALPTFPDCVGVVTSPQAAAWGDVQRTLRERQPGLRVLLSPAIVQGAQAPEAISLALERVVWDGRAAVIILARGGAVKS